MLCYRARHMIFNKEWIPQALTEGSIPSGTLDHRDLSVVQSLSVISAVPARSVVFPIRWSLIRTAATATDSHSPLVLCCTCVLSSASLLSPQKSCSDAKNVENWTYYKHFNEGQKLKRHRVSWFYLISIWDQICNLLMRSPMLRPPSRRRTQVQKSHRLQVLI